MTNGSQNRPAPRIPAGVRDTFGADVIAFRQMVNKILAVYELYGFEPLETPALEYVDVLGKFLPDSDAPQGGVFALRDEDGQWIALRYDLTAPLSRVVAQYGVDLPTPFRRYQIGPVWRMEKPGPDRFRQFYQCDFDTVGTASMAADAEVCAVLSDSFEALGIERGNYLIRVNNRKVLNGVLDMIRLPIEESPGGGVQRLVVLRAIDKLDRLGSEGVLELLTTGRRDSSGDFTPGAELTTQQAEVVLDFVSAGSEDRLAVCSRLRELVGDSAVGQEGVNELEQIHRLLESMHLGSNQVVFDPSVVRGLAYYTGPVFEAILTFEVSEEEGQRRPFGSVAGGGRYDDLVRRFTGTLVPATGCSIGVDRLLTALKAIGQLGIDEYLGPVVVAVLDPKRLSEYQSMVTELRSAGIAAELYLGDANFRLQLKYANRRRSPVAVIAGEDEFGRGEISLKDLRLGKELSKGIKDREVWLRDQPAQISVPREQLVEATKRLLER